MSDDPQNPESADKRGVVKEATTIGKYAYSVVKVIVFVAPLVAVLVIILLALVGPAVGNIFSNIVSSL